MKNKLKVAMVLLLIAFGLAIVMGIVTLVGIFIDFSGYISDLANDYFGANGILSALIDVYADSGLFTEEDINMIMSIAIKASLYTTVFTSIVSIVLSILLIVFTARLKPLINEDISEINNNKKLVKTISILTIIELVFYVLTSSIMPFDPTFVVMLIGFIMFKKDVKQANMMENYDKDRGIVVDQYGNIDSPTAFYEQVPIDDYKDNQEPAVEIKEEVAETVLKYENKKSEEDMEKIYMALARLEKKYKNNEISEEEYQQTKQELLDKIK